MPDQANPTTPATPDNSAPQVPVTRATAKSSATGQAIASQHEEIPQGEDRGSKIPITGDPESKGNQGAQTEPARFGSNGQVPHRTIATPSGPVPAGAMKAPKDAIENRIDRQNAQHDKFVRLRNDRDRRLTEKEIAGASGAELRAIGQQRGYVLPDYAGTRVVRTAFQDAQDKDKNIADKKE